MNCKKLCSGSLTALGLLALILDGKTALAGAQEGIRLCLQTVIPTLFPFFLLTGLATDLLTGTGFPFLRPLARLCRLPDRGSAFLIPAFLGGYPMGAQAVAAAWERGQLSHTAACRMLTFCSNAGPAFLFGMLSPMFPEPWMVWSLWGIHILGALFAAVILPGQVDSVPMPQAGHTDASAIMHRSLSALAAVCGWVICFRILLAFLGRWFLWRLPVPVQILITGLLELANGCCLLPVIPSVSLRYVMAAGLLGLGGVCVAMQTVSVLHGLPLRPYLLGKGIQAGISVLLALSVVRGFWIGLIPAFTAFLVLFPKWQRNSGILRPHAV